nr:type II secretion system protein GspM [uncultured Dethiosulfovibrio sp.]
MKLPQLAALSAVPREIIKPALAAFCAVSLWAVGLSVWAGNSSLNSSIALHQRRMDQLVDVVYRYRSLSDREKRPALTEDPIVVVSSLIGTMGLKDNLVQISSMSRGLNVQLGRMYMEKTLDFLDELEKRGLSVESAEVRAVPEGGARMLSLTLVVTVAS